jgi:hypothetical protein
MWDSNEFRRHPTKWHYIDRQKNTHGPFLLTQLREWRKDGYFGEGFVAGWGDNEQNPFFLQMPSTLFSVGLLISRATENMEKKLAGRVDV